MAIRPKFRPDLELSNADWPKRTPDTLEGLGLDKEEFLRQVAEYRDKALAKSRRRRKRKGQD